MNAKVSIVKLKLQNKKCWENYAFFRKKSWQMETIRNAITWNCSLNLQPVETGDLKIEDAVNKVLYGKKSLVPDCNILAYRKGNYNMEYFSHPERLCQN